MEDLPIITIPDGDLSFEIRNPRYISDEPTGFVCDLNHPELGWIPYGVCDGDAEDTYCYKIWAIKDDLDIAEYVPPEPVMPTVDEIKQQITYKIQVMLDTVAQQKGYDTGVSLASYATSTDDVFHEQANKFVAWRDQCWRTCYDYLDKFNNGEYVFTTIDDFIELLPKFEW